MIEIEKFLDEKGRVKIWASKKEKKYEILKYIASKFESNRTYSEKEVNVIIDEWHTFGDYFLLRRELVESKFLSRTKDCSEYWMNEKSL